MRNSLNIDSVFNILHFWDLLKLEYATYVYWFSLFHTWTLIMFNAVQCLQYTERRKHKKICESIGHTKKDHVYSANRDHTAINAYHQGCICLFCALEIQLSMRLWCLWCLFWAAVCCLWLWWTLGLFTKWHQFDLFMSTPYGSVLKKKFDPSVTFIFDLESTEVNHP